MKKLYLLAFCLLTTMGYSQLSLSQNAGVGGERCISNIRHKQLYASDPVYRQQYDDNQAIIRNLVSSGDRAGTVYIIPVVVHVIHLGEPVGTGTNISDAQIQSAIDNLTDAYRNIGYNGVDVQIQFQLAQRDPFCNATTGINRIDGTNVIGGGDNYSNVGVTGNNETTIKALSVWPNSDYYNIWIVSEIDDNGGGSGTQGYAYFPGAGPSVDGAIILYNSFGYDPTGSIGYNLKSYTRYNATTIHELGHGLNLYHTFEGDDADADGTADQCPANTTCSSDGDQCCDTDAHRRDDDDCIGGVLNTCHGVAGTTVYNNFMAYSSDQCQDRFTTDQKTRMRAALTGTRASLTTSLGATPISGSQPTASQTCQPQTTNLPNGFGIGIFSFTLNTMTVASGSSDADGGYVEKWCTNTTLDVSTLYSVNVTNRIGGNSEDVKVYIDYNNDGDFVDAGEEIFSSNSNTTHSGTFTTPANPVTGTPIWVRVISDFVNNTITGPCYTPQYGQVEDYSITINAGGSPAPTADFSADQTIACQNTNVVFTDASTDATTWSWDFGSGASPATATGVGPHTVSYTTGGTKTVSLDVTGPGGSANRTRTNYITVNPTTVPSVSVSPSANPITSGTNVTFTATPTNGGSTPSYQWKLNGGNVGSNSTTYNNSTLVNGDQVSCVMTSNAACTSPATATSNTVTMTVNAPGSCIVNYGPGGVGTSATNRIWLDASSLTAVNNELVDTLLDKSGNNGKAISSGTSVPKFKTNQINGKPALDFDGVNDYLTMTNVTGINGQSISWFIVGKHDLLTTSQAMLHFSHTGTAQNKNLRYTVYHQPTGVAASAEMNPSGGGPLAQHTASTVYQMNSTVIGTTNISTYTNGTSTGSINQSFYSPISANKWVSIGKRSHLSDYWLDGKVAEVIVFNYQLGTAQRTIVENYLSSKYGLANANDRYAFEGTGHSYDLAGIGQAADASNHLAARGSIVAMQNASSMNNNDYLLWAHNNASTNATNTDVPVAYGGTGQRMTRVWRADKTNDVGTVTITFYLDNIGTGGSNLELLVDTDGIFTNATRITSGFTYDAGCNTATWTGVNLSDGDYFTIGTPDGSALMDEPLTQLETDLGSDNSDQSIIADGIQSVNSDVLIRVYPNPSTGIYTVDHNIESGSMMIYDQTGRLILSQQINSDLRRIDLSHLPAGMYFVQVYDRNKQVIFRNQLIKMNE